MAGFTKLFNSILDSTIWQEPNETRLLWITMLAMSDARGEVQASIPGLARRAGITIPECESGLLTLFSPDKFSRSKEHDGKRIEEVDGGWALLNHGKYRALLSAEERREYNRKKQADHRAKKKLDVNDVSMTVNHNKQCQHISEDRLQKQITEAEVINKEPEIIKKIWPLFPVTSRSRSSKLQLEKEWAKVKSKPSDEDMIDAIGKWANCHEWTKDSGQFAPGAHLWVRNRKWEVDPAPSPTSNHSSAASTQTHAEARQEAAKSVNPGNRAQFSTVIKMSEVRAQKAREAAEVAKNELL